MKIKKHKFYLTESGNVAYVADVRRLWKFAAGPKGQILQMPIRGPLGLDVLTIQAGPTADRAIHMYDGNGNCRDCLYHGHKLIRELEIKKRG